VCAAAAPAGADPERGTDPNADELERVFKQRVRSDRAPVMLVIDGVEAASDGPIVLDLAHPDRSPLAPAAPIVAALAPRLAAKVMARLRAAIQDGQISVAALRMVGLAASYDPRRLELRIDVPPALTTQISHDLGGAPPEAAHALAPSDLSGFVNVRAGGGGNRTHDGALLSTPFHVHSDAAVNLLGWVLEGRGDLVARTPADGPVTLHRGDVVVTRDAPRQAVRFQAGDVGVPATGLQASYPLLGATLGRNFTLQPYRVVRPIGSFDFVLARPSTITVRVNGAPVQTLQLAAGRHDIRDLPLGAGVSDVELVIKDDAGIERTMAFSTANPDALLAPGVVQFSLSAGFPLIADVGLRTYDYDRPIASSRIRAGVTSMLTLGAWFDGDRDHQLGGGGLAVATRLGSLSLEAAESRDRSAGRGWATSARYDYTRSSGGSTRTFTLVGHHYAPGFRDLGPQMVDRRYGNDVAVATTGRLTPRLVGRLDLRYQVGREVPDAQYAAVGLARSFGAVSIDASVSALHDPQSRDDVRLFVTAHWALPERRAGIHAASRASLTSGISNDATYSRRASAPTGGIASSIRLSEDPTAVTAGGTADYTGYRFTTSLTTSAQIDRTTGASSQAAALEVATALAFVGGRLAWSRPITGSFAMVERNQALHGVAVGVNPAAGSYTAQVSALGPAVVPNLEPYRISRVSVDAPALPIGAALGPASYTLLPTYKSGTLLQVGEPGTVFLRGILLHYDGESVPLAVAELHSLDDRKRPVVVVMTNRVGRFSAMGLLPGRYAIRMSGDKLSSGELEIPAGTTGLYSAGVVEVK